MDKIDKFSIKDIINYTGINLNDTQIKRLVVKDESAVREYETLISDKNINYGAFLRRFLEKYEEIIDKDLLVFFTAYNFKKKFDENNNILKLKKESKMTKKSEEIDTILMKKAADLIKSRNLRVVGTEINNEWIDYIYVITARELASCIESGQPLESLSKVPQNKIDRINEFEKILDMRVFPLALSPNDIVNVIINDKEIGENVLFQMQYNATKNYLKKHPEEEEKSQQLLQDLFFFKDGEDFIGQEEKREVLNIQSEVLKRNIRYIDFDKMLLVTAYRYLEKLQEAKGDKDTERTLMETIKILNNLMSPKTTIKGVFCSDKESVLNKFTYKDLQKEMERFTEEGYISTEEISQIKNDLISGVIELKDVPYIKIKIANFDRKEINEIAMQSDSNILFLLKNNEQSIKDNIENILYTKGNCCDELFLYIMEKELLDINKMMALYEAGIFSENQLKQIKAENILLQLNTLVNEKIKDLFEIIANEESEVTSEDMALANRYVNLYKVLNIEGKENNEIDENAQELVSSFEENLSDEVLKALYKYGVISLDVAVDWGINIIDLLCTNDMKPIDVKNLYQKGIINIEAIKMVLVKSNLSYEEKFDLIHSTFDGDSEEERKIREELENYLDIKQGYKNIVRSTGMMRSGTGKKNREYETDAHARWKLLSLIDKNYSKIFLPKGKEIKDGHRVFLLPNLGQVIIERMHERRNGRKVNSYGNATYIMDTNMFYTNINNIVVDGTINRSNLRVLNNNGLSTRIVHSKKWGESVKNYFGMNTQNQRYTEEDLQEIDRALEGVENSRRIRE